MKTHPLLGPLLVCVVACGESNARVSTPFATTSTVTISTSVAPTVATDYLVLVPRAFEKAVAPLVALRTKQGHGVSVRVAEDVYAKRGAALSHEEALLAEVRAAVNESPSLHFVLLAGDPRAAGAELPTFHRKLGAWVGHDAGRDFATDHPYALFPEHPLAVGRLPARTIAELEGMVTKITAYESAPPAEWERRVVVFAGPPNFNPELDSTIESFATSMLDGEVPHDFGLGVLFAEPKSEYAFRFDRLGAEMAHEMSDGALLAVFVGHGSPQSFDTVDYRDKSYPIGTADDFAAINAAHGNPIFIAITCSAGVFDAPRRSISEVAMLNPHGPIASFGAAAFSGAYVNMLYSEQLLKALLVSRSDTVGDAVVTAKTKLPGTSSLALSAVKVALTFGGDGQGDMATSDDAIAEHLFIYNLFGDPATRPAYPERATIATDSAVTPPNHPFDVTVRLPRDGFAHVDVTLETERTNVKSGIVPPDALDKLAPQAAFDAMEKNHALAIDKVVSRSAADVEGRAARVHLVSPGSSGVYWIRAIAVGEGRAAAGALRIEVH